MDTMYGIPTNELLEMTYKMGYFGFLMDTMSYADCVCCFSHACQAVCSDATPTEIDVDQMFSQILEDVISIYFSIHDGKYYHIMKDSILSFYSDKPILRDHISEAFRAFDEKLYYASLMAALPFIENLICSDSTSTAVRRMYAKRVDSPQKIPDFEIELQTANIKGFLDSIFQSAPFSSSEPSSVNRHWLAHGRSNHIVRAVDCYSVFSTIKNLIELLYDTSVSKN